MSKKTVTAAEIEQAVLDLEGVRVVLRVASNKKVATQHYTELFMKRAAKTSNLTSLRKRIAQLVGDTVEVDIIDGGGASSNGNTKLGTLRESYAA